MIPQGKDRGDTENYVNGPEQHYSMQASFQLQIPGYQSNNLHPINIPVSLQDDVPFESLSVIVPSKSLNTITFVSGASNGIFRIL